MQCASLCLEWIGHDAHCALQGYKGMFDMLAPGMGDWMVGKASPRIWAAEITGKDPRYGLSRSFLRAKLDYSRANSKGSRGVEACYILYSDHVYEVNAAVSWKRNRRYFCRVDDGGNIVEISREEVDEWLRSHPIPY